MEVSLSKFHALKPIEIDTFGNIPHAVCLCIYHENIRLILEVLSPFVGIPTNFREMLANVTCSQENALCMTQISGVCKYMYLGFHPLNFLDSPETMTVSVEQWTRLDRGGPTEKVKKQMNLLRCFEEFADKLLPFCKHVLIKRVQAKSFQNSISSVDGKNMVMQIDFAENFDLVQQKEVQSAHFNHPQCTIFTAHV